MTRDLFITVHKITMHRSQGMAIKVNPLAIASMATDGQGRAVINFVGGALSYSLAETPEQVEALIRGESVELDIPAEPEKTPEPTRLPRRGEKAKPAPPADAAAAAAPEGDKSDGAGKSTAGEGAGA